MYPRVSRYVHDPITATALVLENGEEQAIFVSLDMTEVPCHAMAPLQAALAEYSEIKFGNISFNVTHTHNSSSFYNDFMRSEDEQVYDPKILPPFEMPANTLYLDAGVAFFVEKLRKLIVAVWEKRTPGGISYAHDYAAIGFCRRPQFRLADGSAESIMYGDCSRSDFVRFEGDADTSVERLYTWNEAGEVTGVACNVPCPS